MLEGKIRTANPLAIPKPPDARTDAKYIRYTPSGVGADGAAPKQRIIRMVEDQVDPMEPPKHKHNKLPRGAPDAPVPVLHSPPRKITVADQQAWKIPPCISNWKNARGCVNGGERRRVAAAAGSAPAGLLLLSATPAPAATDTPTAPHHSGSQLTHLLSGTPSPWTSGWRPTGGASQR
jgi:hypothetical protein